MRESVVMQCCVPGCEDDPVTIVFGLLLCNSCFEVLLEAPTVTYRDIVGLYEVLRLVLMYNEENNEAEPYYNLRKAVIKVFGTKAIAGWDEERCRL